jgi:hypothetical protein
MENKKLQRQKKNKMSGMPQQTASQFLNEALPKA